MVNNTLIGEINAKSIVGYAWANVMLLGDVTM